MTLNTKQFCKVLALAGSDRDGEALSALRRAHKMLAAAGLSFTDVAQSIGKTGGHRPREHDGEAEALRQELTETEVELDLCRCELEQSQRKLKELERTRPGGKSLKRSLAAIEARMRAVLRDRRLARLSDRELARRTGLSAQTVGNWRRRVATERAPVRRMSTMDRKDRSRARAA